MQNVLVLIVTALYVGQSVWVASQGRWWGALIWAGYALANLGVIFSTVP